MASDCGQALAVSIVPGSRTLSETAKYPGFTAGCCRLRKPTSRTSPTTLHPWSVSCSGMMPSGTTSWRIAGHEHFDGLLLRRVGVPPARCVVPRTP